MSETVSAGASAGAAATPAATSSGQSAGTGQSQAPQTGGAAPPAGVQDGGTQQAQDQRVLAEQDLDAYIEHTINGRKERVKVRDALKGYGMETAARQKMSEAANIEHRQRQLNHLFQTDFDKWCDVTGTDRDAFLRSNLAKRKEIATEILAKEYELQQMNPDQRKALELEQQLTQMKEREAATKKPIIDQIKQIVSEDRLPRGLENATEAELKSYLAQRQQEFNQGMDQISNELLEAWQRGGLPREKFFGQRMAQVMLDHDKRAKEHFRKTGEQIQPLQSEKAASIVKREWVDSTRSMFSQMDAKAIQEALGPEIIQKLRDHDVGLASAQRGPSFDKIAPSNQGASEPKKALNQMEWRKAMGIAT